MITIARKTDLGLKILGGINQNEGPFVYIQEIIPGGDCHKVKMKIKNNSSINNHSVKKSMAMFVFLIHQLIFSID